MRRLKHTSVSHVLDPLVAVTSSSSLFEPTSGLLWDRAAAEHMQEDCDTFVVLFVALTQLEVALRYVSLLCRHAIPGMRGCDHLSSLYLPYHTRCAFAMNLVLNCPLHRPPPPVAVIDGTRGFCRLRMPVSWLAATAATQLCAIDKL